MTNKRKVFFAILIGLLAVGLLAGVAYAYAHTAVVTTSATIYTGHPYPAYNVKLKTRLGYNDGSGQRCLSVWQIKTKYRDGWYLSNPDGPPFCIPTSWTNGLVTSQVIYNVKYQGNKIGELVCSQYIDNIGGTLSVTGSGCEFRYILRYPPLFDGSVDDEGTIVEVE